MASLNGTALRRRLARAGRLLEDRDWSSHTLFDVTYQPDRLQVEELQRAFTDLVRDSFSKDQTIRRRAIRRAVWSKKRAMST